MRNYLILFAALVISATLVITPEANHEKQGISNPTCKHPGHVHSTKNPDDFISFNPNEKVILIGLDDVAQSEILKAKNILRNFFRCTIEIKENINLEDHLYYDISKTIIDPDKFVRNYTPEYKTVYITNKSMYAQGTYCRGYTTLKGDVAIVATGSFLGETLVHEMGHTYGLLHCEDLACVMAIYNDQYDKGTFCEKCRDKIGYY
ncbi:MAG: hypothetical protein ACK452_06015 [Bacteroidota bacterium]|jgi:predicted Zn-dependent protease